MNIIILIIYLIQTSFSELLNIRECQEQLLYPKFCIESTKHSPCIFHERLKFCLPIQDTNKGCSNNLNEKACINQLSDQYGKECQCIFNLRCQKASIIQLSNLGCFDKFNKHACMNVRNHRCQWDISCQYVSNEQIEFISCDQQYKMPVSPLVCSSIPKLECMNSGSLGDYKCVSIQEKDYQQLKCSELGLTELACRKIIAFEEKCIFSNNVCRQVQNNEIVNCNQKINKLACLSINNPNLNCYWMNHQCLEFKVSEENQEILSNVSVSASVCAKLQDSYKFDTEKYQCVLIPLENSQILDCNTIGLSKKGCLLIKNKNCSFYGGKCQELNEQDLKSYLCEMDLNEQACVNLETEFQYCQWNGSNCKRMFMNQDINCPLQNNDLMKVNGNVCQAISKSDVLCKYDQKTNLCVISTNYDKCNTPFLNFFGCIGIQNHHQTCQWYQNKCRIITIQQNSTLCETLKNVNPYSCSQVYQSNSIGCYYDKDSYQCKSILIDSDSQLLNTISCKDLSLGINKVLCASITTPFTPCRWYQEQCSFVEYETIKSIPCQNHIYANYQVCAQIEYNKAKCFYSQQNKQCFELKTGDDVKACNSKGLNKYACSSIEEFCYFENFTCKDAKNNLNNILCQSSYPSKKACLAITTKGQFCKWSDKINQCIDFIVEENHKCETKEIQLVNHLVCASVINYVHQLVQEKDFKGYCHYNQEQNFCQVPPRETYQCTTKCCTEDVGINAHACIKFSNESDNCYFYDLRCQELTEDLVDINDPKQIKQYFNALNLPCSSVMKKYCHMIDWSETQRCFSYGDICIHFNTNYYPNIKELIELQNPVFNKFACLSVEGNSQENINFKYLTYDEGRKTCLLATKTQYKSCEDVKGNRNVCMSHTENLYCRWNADKLKCVTITKEELYEIQSCQLNQNKKACLENKHKNCSFDGKNDRCLNFRLDVINDEQLMVQSVCVQLEGVPYEFYQSKICSQAEIKVFPGCFQYNINNKACYKYSQGYCRWNSEFFFCYENEDEINTLSCSDNLNKVLCLVVTKEGCVWNEEKYQCQSNKEITYNNCENEQNELACLSIKECIYNQEEKKCKRLQENINCSDAKQNKDGCLLNTRGHKCQYTDGNCQQYQSDQTICDSEIDINIEVCMDIPQPCYFNIKTLKCENVKIETNTTCQSLFMQLPKSNTIADQEFKEGRYYNKIACSSISMDLELEYGGKQCLEGPNTQQCNYEKYCFWNSINYTCNVYELVNSAYDEYYHSETTEYLWKSENYNDNVIIVEDFEKQESKECFKQNNSTDEKLEQNNISICENVNKKCQADQNCKSFTHYEIPKNIEEAREQIIKAADKSDANSNCSQYCQPNNSCSQNNQGSSLHFTKNDLELKKVCQSFKFYVSHPLCSNFPNKITDCKNIYSKALCLQYIEENCYFDINQGGCRQLKGNEHKLPDCSSISNQCNTSNSKNAICQVKETLPKCQIVKIKTTQCQKVVNLKKIAFGQKCSEIMLAQPILCAKAQDKCRFDGIKCISTDPEPCECDKSYSEELCEKCKCNYKFLGYCQKESQVPQLNDDYSNQYYLCYEVTMFVANNQEIVCGQVDQTCKFKDNKCEDATHSTCDELKNLIVSYQACVRCQGQAMKYNRSTYKCEPVSENIKECENLNKKGCLSYSKEVKCKWIASPRQNEKKFDFNCLKIDEIDKLDQLDCAILNEDACNKEQINLCWFDQETQLCVKYNPFKGECTSFMNNLTCIQSMIQSCVWEKKCQIASEQQQCEGLNKFGCLHLESQSCVWSDNNHKCESAIFNDQPKNCSDLNQSDISHMNGLTCTSINIQKPCILGQNYKCREIIEPMLYKCETIGLNQKACILKTQNKCAFIDQKCVPIDTDKVGCKDYLNQNACINQKQGCYFDDSCKKFEIENYDQLSKSSDKKYSPNFCKQFDMDSNFTKSLIYSQILGRCIDISQQNAFVSECGSIGINKFACLSKTQGLCQYIDLECKISKTKQFNECDPNLNWVACVNKNQKCKFVQSKCQPLSNESCVSLKQEKAIINQKVCTNTVDKPCKYDSNTLTCTDDIDQDEPCSALGLNQKGCIFNTKSSKCKFENNECKSDYQTTQTAQCTDKINERKCLSLKAQNCQFLPIDGCQINIQICNNNTCSSEFCFYDEVSKDCKQIKLNGDQLILPNLDSLNQQACLDIENSTTFWNDGCRYATEELLKTLECDDQLNKVACRNVKTESQYCLFQNESCRAYDKDLNNECEKIGDINNGIICSQIRNQDCKYDSSQQKCAIVDQEESKQLNCDEKALQFYNKQACEQDNNCIFIEKCIQKKDWDQKKEHCIIQKMPSFLNGGECKQKEKQISDSCQDITAMSGNLNACIQVEKFGEMCVFKDYKCQTIDENEENYNSCPNNINKNACLQQTKFKCFWNQTVHDNALESCEIFVKHDESDCENNLSFKACLSISKEGTYCQWKHGQCQKIQENELDFKELSIKRFVNSNTCHLIKNVAVSYDEIVYTCVQIKSTDYLSCSPPIPGMNYLACLLVKRQNQLCTWNHQKKVCYNNQEANFKNQVQNCQIQGINPIYCSQRKVKGPCGGIEEGCDQVDLNLAKCNQIGLNREACVNLKSQPCTWVEGLDDDIDHCEEKIPGKCEGNDVIVNALVCSMVAENEACSYDSQNHTCKRPDNDLTDCNVQGINSYGCVQIQNCYFKNLTCILFDSNSNISCRDANFANESVCSQIKDGTCKYNQLGFGCIESSFDDICSTPGINMHGCNQLDQCQWKDKKCQCKKVIMQQKDCFEHQDQENCNNSSKCYFDISQIEDSQRVCKEKYCGFEKVCNYQLESGKVCYQDINGKCNEANSCNQIINPQWDCSEYLFDNIPCISEDENRCVQFESCEKLNQIECSKYTRECVLLLSCVTKQCHHNRDKQSCINFNCTWIDYKCREQISCSEIKTEYYCSINYQNGMQCSWHNITENHINNQFCTFDGCNSLQKNIFCHGVQVLQSVCLQVYTNICLTCQQILDPCECMNHADHCQYDVKRQVCISLPCENYNELSCPQSRCQFNQQNKICIPQCQFNYNKKQCQQFEICTWDDLFTPPCYKVEIIEEIPESVYLTYGLILYPVLPFIAMLL